MPTEASHDFDLERAEPYGPTAPPQEAATVEELRRIRRLIGCVGLLVAGVALFFAKMVLLPLIIGMLLALTLSPLLRGGVRMGLPAPLVAVMLVLGIGGGLALGIYTLSGPASEIVDQAPGIGDRLKHKLRGFYESLEFAKTTAKEVEELAEGDAAGEPQEVVVKQPGILNAAISSVTDMGLSIALALVLALFILSSDGMFHRRLAYALRGGVGEANALKILRDIERRISHYLLTVTMINLCLGASIATVFWLIGMPAPIFWGVLACALNFLPFIGAVIGAALAGAISIVTFPTLGEGLMAPGLYLLLTGLEGQILTPLILGRRMEVNTIVVFAAVIFWGWLWGMAGALLAVPILVVIKVICDNVDGCQGLGDMIGAGEPRRRRRQPDDVKA